MSSSQGRLTLITGPMFAAKTTLLCNELNKLADLDRNVLYINHSKDQRKNECCSQNVTTHNRQLKGLSDKVTALSCSKLSSVEKDIEKYDFIGIDEAQFFEDLEEVVRKWVLIDKKNIWVSGLSGNYRIDNFGQIKELYCLADDFFHLKAFCSECNKEKKTVYAAFSQRKVEFSEDSQGIHVGGSETYQPVCLYHFQQSGQWLIFEQERKERKIIEQMIEELLIYLIQTPENITDFREYHQLKDKNVLTRNNIIKLTLENWKKIAKEKDQKQIKTETFLSLIQIPILKRFEIDNKEILEIVDKYIKNFLDIFSK